jgi:hypothetical protein
MGWLIGGIAMVVYMLFVVYVGVTKKPPFVWELGKVKGFRSILGDMGTQIFFVIFGLAVGGFGIWFITMGL